VRLHEAAEHYVKVLESWGRSRSTLVSYDLALRQLAAWLLAQGVIDTQAVTPRHLRSFGAALLTHRYKRSNAQGAVEKPLASSTRYNRLNHIRHFFGWLTKEGITLTDASSGLELGFCGRGLPVGVLTEDEAQRLLSAPPQTILGLRNRAVLELFYSSGLRRGELSALDLSDVDLSARLVFVRCGKGGKARLVPLGQSAQSAITRYLKESRPDLQNNPSTAALFLGSKGVGCGKRLKGCGIGDLVKQAAKATGIERRVTTHTLRHSFATHLLRGGAGIRHVQEMLGHSRIDTTEVYTHVAIPDLLKVHARCHPRGGEEKSRGPARSCFPAA
jgi:integrase/recombinase XerD